ncbi:MAG TPA: HlyD family efflux transporter periplasmic adaptor subunit [Micromonosporaceae bacterium]|jgi:multidrug efflux pump subunit AcrA (membrane-fusion protein)
MVRVRRAPSPPSLVVALAGVVALTVTAASCNDRSGDIGVGTVAQGSVVEVVDAPASVTARAAATLTAAADGTLASLRVGAGDRVRVGQVLAVISSPEARTRLAQAKKALAAASRAGGGGGGVNLVAVQRSTDRAAADAFARARDAAERIADQPLREALLAQVAAAERHYDAAARAANQAVRAVQRGVAGLSSAMSALSAAQRLQAQQAYALAKSTVDALTLRAPIAGVVQLGGPASATGAASLTDLLGATGADTGVAGIDSAAGAAAVGGGSAALPGVDGSVPAGGRVSAGTPVLTIVDTGVLGLLADVDETDVLLVRPGVRASVELDAATGASYDATVRTVDVLPTPSARGGVAYRVRLTLGPGRYADGRSAPIPRPGMSAVAHLRVREAVSAVTVPAAAVFSSGGHDAVWLVRDGRAERVEVTVGVQGRDVVQIVDGVRPGERVVVRGADQVHVGQQVP